MADTIQQMEVPVLKRSTAAASKSHVTAGHSEDGQTHRLFTLIAETAEVNQGLMHTDRLI